MERVHKQYSQRLHCAITQKFNPSVTNNTFKEPKLSLGLIKYHVIKSHAARDIAPCLRSVSRSMFKACKSLHV